MWVLISLSAEAAEARAREPRLEVELEDEAARRPREHHGRVRRGRLRRVALAAEVERLEVDVADARPLLAGRT